MKYFKKTHNFSPNSVEKFCVQSKFCTKGKGFPTSYIEDFKKYH